MMKLALIGFGVVGQGLAEVLRDRAEALQKDYGFHAMVTAVATQRRGSLFHPQGLDVQALLDAVTQGHLDHYPEAPGLQRNWNALQLLRESGADVMVEATHSNFKDAQPALGHCHAALESGMHIVLANKGPVALAYADLAQRARKARKIIGLEATVMAGTPSIRLALEALSGCQIREARGILNGTTNFILTEMEKGMSYGDALALAQKLGYAEADPSADVDGWDAAGKALILAAALFGSRLTLADMQVTGIGGITLDEIAAAQQAGERWKLIARVTPDGGSVQPIRLPVTDPLAHIGGATNAITYVTDLLGSITLSGPGAGRQQTGFGLLADLLAIQRWAAQ